MAIKIQSLSNIWSNQVAENQINKHGLTCVVDNTDYLIKTCSDINKQDCLYLWSVLQDVTVAFPFRRHLQVIYMSFLPAESSFEGEPSPYLVCRKRAGMKSAQKTARTGRHRMEP